MPRCRNLMPRLPPLRCQDRVRAYWSYLGNWFVLVRLLHVVSRGARLDTKSSNLKYALALQRQVGSYQTPTPRSTCRGPTSLTRANRLYELMFNPSFPLINSTHPRHHLSIPCIYSSTLDHRLTTSHGRHGRCFDCGLDSSRFQQQHRCLQSTQRQETSHPRQTPASLRGGRMASSLLDRQTDGNSSGL